jgi:hypothetical protein
MGPHSVLLVYCPDHPDLVRAFYFLRYGLQNRTIVALNTLFLIIVLFYVYPLKFLAKFLLLPIASLAGQDELFQEIRSMMPFGEMSTLMIIYGTGATFIFIVLTLMYRYAFKRSDELGLNEIETFDTRTSMQTNLLMASVPALSVVLAILFRNNKAGGAISGFSYMIYPVVMFGHGYLVDKKRKQLLLNSELEKPVLHKEEPAKTEELLDS